MIDTKSFDILSPGYNTEIIEVVERAWIKSTVTTKEQKDKNIHDIFHTYLDRLNKTLKSNESADLADLILEKSVFLTNSTGVHDWPGAETLKVADFHRLTIFLYNYNKFRFTLNAQTKIKELNFKAFENLAKFLEVLMELTSMELSEELLFSIYNDVFYFYIRAREEKTLSEENKTKVEEDMRAIIEMIYEETNIKGLIKIGQIEQSNNKFFFMGVLTLLLDYKINKFEKNLENAEEAKKTIEIVASQHLNLLKELSTVAYFDLTLIRAAYNFFDEKSIVENMKHLLSAYKNYKIYRNFRKSIPINIYLKNFQESSKHLLLLYFIATGIKIDSNILYLLTISNQDLISINLQNFILIDSFLKAENFPLLRNLYLLENIREVLCKISQNRGPLIIENKGDILGIIFENQPLKGGVVDFIELQSSLNLKFKDLKREVLNIK